MPDPTLQSPLCFNFYKKNHHQCKARSYASIPFAFKKNPLKNYKYNTKYYALVSLVFQNNEKKKT
jgi:hypothetical protein